MNNKLCNHINCQNPKSSKIGFCSAHTYQYNTYGKTWDILDKGDNLFTFIPNSGIVEMSISKKYITTFDIEDYSIVSKYRWYIINNHSSTNQYAHTNINNKTVRLHRYILDISSPNILVDHIDGNGLNNSKHNLRICTTHSHNNANSFRTKSNVTGYQGVNISGNKFTAVIKYMNKKIHIGTFNSPELAHKAYCDKGFELYGEFFRVNNNI